MTARPVRKEQRAASPERALSWNENGGAMGVDGKGPDAGANRGQGENGSESTISASGGAGNEEGAKRPEWSLHKKFRKRPEKQDDGCDDRYDGSHVYKPLDWLRHALLPLEHTLSQHALRVAMRLWSHHNGRRGCWPSIETLTSERHTKSKRSVEIGINELVSAGLLEVVSGGGEGANEYLSPSVSVIAHI